MIVLFLGILNALTPFTIDLYLPAFADIATDLGTTVPRVSLSVAAYFVGYALGQLLYGPFLDRFGRKPPIYVGLGIYIVSTIGCMLAQSVEALLIFRFLSALGGSAASVGAVTMVRDYFTPKEGARVFAMLMLVLSVSPLFAPTIGGWIAAEYGWRTIFGLLVVFAIIDVFILMFGLPKRYQPDTSVNLSIGPVLKGYLEIFKIQQFRTYTVAGALSFAGLFVYLAGSPSIYLDGFQISKQGYGLVFALLAVGMIGGGQVNGLLLRRSSSASIFMGAVTGQVLLAVVFVIAILYFNPGLYVTTGFLFLLLGCCGISYPNAASLALAPLTKNVGSASSLLGFIQMGLGAVLASLIGIVGAEGTLPTALVMAGSASLAWIVLFRNARRNLTPSFLGPQRGPKKKGVR